MKATPEINKPVPSKPSEFETKATAENVQNRERLRHSDLLLLSNLLKYKTMEDGICNGFTLMLLQAVLAQDEKNFFARLEFIESYKPTTDDPGELNSAFTRLTQDIDRAKAKVAVKENLGPKDEALLQIPALFDGIRLYQQPRGHADLFNGLKIYQKDFLSIFNLLKPIDLESNQLHQLFEKSYFFDIQSLYSFILLLEDVLKTLPLPCPVLLSNFAHIVLLTYDKKKHHWSFTDINDLSGTSGASFYHILDREELVERLFTSWRTYSENLMLTTRIFATQDLKTLHLEDAFSDIEEFYALTSDQAYKVNNEGVGLLHPASNSNDPLMLQQLLSYPNIDVNQAENGYGLTALMIACMCGRLANVQRLLDHHQIDINKVCAAGFSAIWFAYRNDELEILRAILKHPQLRINDTLEGETLFYNACKHGKIKVVWELLQRAELDVNLLCNGVSALEIACQHGNRELIKMLVSDPRVNINQLNDEGKPVFWEFCKSGDLEIVLTFLKRKDLDINYFSKKVPTAFYAACVAGEEKIVQALSDCADLDMNLLKDNEKSALAALCMNGQIEMIDLLLGFRPKLQINATGPRGITPFFYACMKGNIEVAKRLFDTGDVKLNHVDIEGNTALHAACQTPSAGASKEKMFEWLLKNKFDIHVKNAKGLTPLDIAIQKENTTAISALCQFILTNGKDLDDCVSCENREELMTRDDMPEVVMDLKNALNNKATQSLAEVKLSNIAHLFSGAQQSETELENLDTKPHSFS